MDLKALTLVQLARLHDALRSKFERTRLPSACFALVRVEAEVGRRVNNDIRRS